MKDYIQKTGANIRLGTRGSALALRQVSLVTERLAKLDCQGELSVQVVKIVTTGDKGLPSQPEVVQDKSIWIKEIEEALLQGEIDVAIHCGKDVPLEINPNTELFSVLNRASAEDIFIPHPHLRGADLNSLDFGSVIGTASLRRQAQLLRFRSDFIIRAWRGNVPTRLQRLKESDELSGIVVARAGVERLGINIDHKVLPEQSFVPGVNQGILVLQILKENSLIRHFLRELVVPDVEHCFSAERACIETLGADCHSAVGVKAEVKGVELRCFGQVLSVDGKEVCEAQVVGQATNARQVGCLLGERLLSLGAKAILTISHMA